MANVIEILIQAKNSASAEIEKASGGMTKFATAAGLGAAAGAMAGQLIQRAMQEVQNIVITNTLAMSDYAEMLGRVGQDSGLSTQQLQVFRREVERNGVSSDTLSQSLRFFNDQLATGGLAKYGATSRDTFTALQQLSKAYMGAGDAAGRVEIASAALGGRNAQLARSVFDVAAAYDGRLSDALGSGYVMSNRLETALNGLDGSLDNFKDTTMAFKLAAADLFSGPIKSAVDFLNALNGINQWFEGNKAKAMDDLKKELGGSGRSWTTNASSGGGAMFGPGNDHGLIDLRRSREERALARVVSVRKPLAFSGATGFEPNAIASLMQALAGYSGSAQGALKTSMGRDFDGSTLSGKDASEPMRKSFTAIQEAAASFGSNFEGSLRGTLMQALSITTTSNNLIVQSFTSLANAVASTIAEMMARAAAAGLVKLALSFIPGGGAISAGAKIGATFGTSMRAGGGGGDTYIVSSINQADAYANLTNPTGSLRRANDRIYDLRVAAMG